MTRASLLHILDHVSEISAAEVLELEQLAGAFPYCQTAHLLLAKAAHDRGSMLASQRLRRAATYATDRQLLRQLIELPAPTAAPVLSLPAAPPEADAEVGMPESAAAPVASLTVAVAPAAVAAPDDLPAAEVTAAALPAEDALFDVPAAVVAPAGPAPVEPTEPELAPAAPPIRPPADSGSSRFEFGLAAEVPAVAAYELAPLETSEELLPPAAPVVPPVPVFHADADLGYGLAGGSRLGYGLQEQDAYALNLPLDAFFQPDALLLAHAATHQPRSTPPRASSTDLISQFLRAQPRLRTPAPKRPDAEQQDLSVRSTRAEPDLASESLARIMVRQGKTDKAIEIYERLMLRQPEKKAYFATQIQQLKPTE